VIAESRARSLDRIRSDSLPVTSAGQRQVTTEVLDIVPYPVGSTTPVLLDPQDVSWSRLVAEPQDPTGWESAGLGALLPALLLGLIE
jgi:hypothetical protein